MRTPATALKRPVVSLAGIRAALTPTPKLRRRMLVAALLAALLAAGYMLWLRDSSLVAVEDVTVTGVTARDGERIRSALASTAQTMTTLNVDVTRLEETAAVFPVVRAIEVEPDFPHGLEVHVIEHRPAALLDADGRTVPVARDGTVLAGVTVEGDLPTIDFSGAVPRRQVPPGAARDAAAVAGAAPPAIARRIESIGREGGARGVVAQIADGPEIVFGGKEQAAAKWAGAVRVLADEESAGATYIDVRVPERPVAGGLAAATITPAAPVAETPVEPVDPAVDPNAVAPVEPTYDPAAVAPDPTLQAPAPETVTPAAPTAPEATGGLTP